MKTLSDEDWAIAEAAVKRQMDVTLSRAEHKQLSDMLGRVSHTPPYAWTATAPSVSLYCSGDHGRSIIGDPGDEI